MHILIVAPTSREYANMVATLQAQTSLRHTYQVICSGIGKAASAASVAMAIAKAEKPFDRVVVIGFAAATLGFQQGDVVSPSVARYHDCDVPEGFIPELTDPFALAGGEDITVFTGDSFVNAQSVAAIKSHFGAERAIFDMEITAIAIAAKQCGDVAVSAVKFVSDVPEAGHTELSYDEFADSHSDFSPLLDVVEQM